MGEMGEMGEEWEERGKRYGGLRWEPWRKLGLRRKVFPGGAINQVGLEYQSLLISCY